MKSVCTAKYGGTLRCVSIRPLGELMSHLYSNAAARIIPSARWPLEIVSNLVVSLRNMCVLITGITTSSSPATS